MNLYRFQKIACIFSILVASQSALACYETRQTSFDESVKSAKSIFIFRLNSLGLVKPNDKTSYLVAGQIEPLEVIRGKTPYKYITHDGHLCGALHLEVGHYYLIATSQDGPGITLYSADQSALDISSSYPITKDYTALVRIIELIKSGSHIPTSLSFNNYGAFIYAFPPTPDEYKHK